MKYIFSYAVFAVVSVLSPAFSETATSISSPSTLLPSLGSSTLDTSSTFYTPTTLDVEYIAGPGGAHLSAEFENSYTTPVSVNGSAMTIKDVIYWGKRAPAIPLSFSGSGSLPRAGSTTKADQDVSKGGTLPAGTWFLVYFPFSVNRKVYAIMNSTDAATTSGDSKAVGWRIASDEVPFSSVPKRYIFADSNTFTLNFLPGVIGARTTKVDLKVDTHHYIPHYIELDFPEETPPNGTLSQLDRPSDTRFQRYYEFTRGKDIFRIVAFTELVWADGIRAKLWIGARIEKLKEKENKSDPDTWEHFFTFPLKSENLGPQP